MANTRKYLGKQHRGVGSLDLIPLKSTPRHQLDEVTLHVEEFTSLCPVTGQPDFGRVEITYCPIRFLVETKSLKLWLRRYRNLGVYNEMLAHDIAQRLGKALKCPVSVTVKMNVRGGIGVEATASGGK